MFKKDETSIKVDFKQGLILSEDEFKVPVIIESLEAVDTGELIFFIFDRNLSFIQHETKSYLRSGLFANESQEENINGKGFVNSYIKFFCISEEIPRANQLNQSAMRSKYKREPKDQIQVKFNLDQNLLFAIKQSQSMIIQINPSKVDKEGSFISSVIFER